MKTRCPSCHTAYDVEPQVLQPAQGFARCFRCGTVFNAFQCNPGDTLRPKRDHREQPAPGKNDSILQLQESDTSFLTEDSMPTPEPTSVDKASPDREERRAPSVKEPQGEERAALPFDIPDDLEEIEPTEEADLDSAQALQATPPHRSPWWQKALTVILLLTLGAQLAWIQRDLWIDHPLAIQACAVLHCRLPESDRPQDFHVIERNMQLVPGKPPVLRLSLTMRNDARLAQPLPRLELSLLDGGGAVLARRLFPPEAYLPPNWVGPTVALPGEVITIELKLKDPGPRARGFTIEFL